MVKTTQDIINKISNERDKALAAKAIDDAIDRIGLQILLSMKEHEENQSQAELPLQQKTFINNHDVERIWRDNGFKWVDSLPF